MQISSPTYYKNNNIQINSPAFNGLVNMRLKTPVVKGDAFVPQVNAKANQKALELIKSLLSKRKGASVDTAYNACMNSDGNIFKDALSLLKREAEKHQRSTLGVFKSKTELPYYTKFGFDFISYLIEASKDNEKNHQKQNLNFLEMILEHYESKKPTDYLDMLVNSKDSDGNISSGAFDLFNAFMKTKSLEKYAQFMQKLSKLPAAERGIIFKHYPNLKDRDTLFKILEHSSGKDQARLLQAVDKDLGNIAPETIDYCISRSKTKDDYPLLENYEKLREICLKDNELAHFHEEFKDKDGNIKDENITFVKQLRKVLKDKKAIQAYTTLSKDSDKVVRADFSSELLKALAQNGTPEDYANIIRCISASQNKKGDVNWDVVNIFHSLKKITDKVDEKSNHSTFDKIIAIIKDKNGDVIPELVFAVHDLCKQGLTAESPSILSISKKGDKLNKTTFDEVTKVLAKTSGDDRKAMLTFLKTCIDSNGDFDVSRTKIIEQVQSKNIKKDVINISNALKNPDGTYSTTGLTLIEDLRKMCHHQVEEDLAEVLTTCRDKSGYLNKKSVSTVLGLAKLNHYLNLPETMKLVINSDMEVDDNKLKIITQIISHSDTKDPRTIAKIMHAAKDKHGVVDMGVLKLVIKLNKQGKAIDSYTDLLPAYRGLYKYENVSSLSQLNLRQKRNLMRCLKNHKNSIMSPRFKEILDSKIIPANDSEYCSMMGKLSHSVGTSVSRLPRQVKTKYYKAMEHLADPKGEFMNIDFSKDTPVLELNYSLKDFKKDVWNIVKDSHYSDRTKALDYFGFELKDTDGALELTGFPSADKPDGRLASIKDQDVLNLIKKVNPLVEKFTTQNTVTVKNHPQLSQDLTDIIKAFPEFITTIGKVQHGTHDFTLDVHCLRVLQDVMKNPDYATLTKTDKREMQIIALLHDLTKAENKRDPSHPEQSAFDVYYLLDKLDMEEKDKLEIYNVINYHDWLKDFDFSDWASRHMAFRMRGGEALKMLFILTQADLKGVKKFDAFYKQHADKLHKARKAIYPRLYELKRTAINLPQARIPKASELNSGSHYVKKIHSDGITNTVLYLQRGIDLRKVGFESCRDLDDFNVIVHGLDNRDAAAMFQALGMMDAKGLLSTSYVIYSKGNYRAFRNEGFILDVPATNIHVAFWRDFGSGYKKSTKDLYSTYLFRNNPMRNYISDALMKLLHINSKEYLSIFKKIEDMPIEKLEKKHPRVAQAYKKLFTDMEVSKRSFGRNYNEILVTSPKIQAVFCYGKTPESLSVYMRRYAERNNVPIIVFG